MSVYRVSGVVEAADGTTYRPLFYGDFYAACRVRDAIADGAYDRGEAFEVNVSRSDGRSISTVSGSSRRVEVTA